MARNGSRARGYVVAVFPRAALFGAGPARRALLTDSGELNPPVASAMGNLTRKTEKTYYKIYENEEMYNETIMEDEMYLSLLERKFHVRPKKILHIGANRGQEVENYSNLGIAGYHIEAIQSVYEVLKHNCEKYKDQYALNVCLDNIAGKTVEFNIANSSVFSSILGIGRRHEKAFPSVKYVDKFVTTTTTVDLLIEGKQIPTDVDFCVIDVQGAEFRVLSGATRLLESGSLQGIYVEVSHEPLYEGGAAFDQIFALLEKYGFWLLSLEIGTKGWGNALFLKRWWASANEETATAKLAMSSVRRENIATQARCRVSSLGVVRAGQNDPQMVVSGQITGRFSFTTNMEANPWLVAEFATPESFDEIVVYNHLGNGSARANTLVVSVSDDEKHWRTLWENKSLFGGRNRRPLRINCPGTKGKFVRFQIPGRNRLHLDFIEINKISA
jgi:FkbM family methyltransferase